MVETAGWKLILSFVKCGMQAGDIMVHESSRMLSHCIMQSAGTRGACCGEKEMGFRVHSSFSHMSLCVFVAVCMVFANWEPGL